MTMRPAYRFTNSSIYPSGSNNESKISNTSTDNLSFNNLRFTYDSNVNIPRTSFDHKVFSNHGLHRSTNVDDISKSHSEQMPSNYNNNQFITRLPPPNNTPLSASSADNNSHSIHHYLPPPIPHACFLPPDGLNSCNLNQQSCLPVSRHIPIVQNSENSADYVSQANFIHSNKHIIPPAPNFVFREHETSLQSRFLGTHNYKSCINDTHHLQSNVRNVLPPMSENSLNVPKNTENLMTTPTSTINSNIQSHNNLPIIPENIERNFAIRHVVPISMQVPPPIIHSGIPLHFPPPPISSTTFSSIPRNDYSPLVPINNAACSLFSEKEWKLREFLTKFTEEVKKSKKDQVTIPEFRSVLVAGFSISKELLQRKNDITNLLQTDDDTWISEMKQISNLKDKLSEICSFVNAPLLLSRVMKKLKVIKKKREQKKKTKLNKQSAKIKAVQRREDRNQEIDKWLDDIKEKNMKLKREAEMKKEADCILLEVRKKIHEAKRTIEKIKVFEKLRTVRQANAVKKGLHITSEHNENFERKISILKGTILRQLVDYEAEENALKVMLETEQEGQLEEEIQWKIKKSKMLQYKKQKYILECLFGNSEDPQPTDALYLFHKFHTSANISTENLVQIRHQWDVYIADDGESVPQQWVMPTFASDSTWERCLMSSGSSKN